MFVTCFCKSQQKAEKLIKPDKLFPSIVSRLEVTKRVIYAFVPSCIAKLGFNPFVNVC